MKNQWKQISDVSPQTERGSRRIASDLYVAIIMADLGAVESQILQVVIHLTYGYHRLEAEISYREFRFFTGKSRQSIIENVRKLVNKRLLVKESKLVNGRLPVNRYMLNKYYDTWITLTSTPLLTSLQVKLVKKYRSNWSKSAPPTGQRTLTPILVSSNKLYKGVEKNKSAPTKIDTAGLAILTDLGIEPPEDNLQKSHKRKNGKPEDPDFEF